MSDWIGSPPTGDWQRNESQHSAEPPPLRGPLPIVIGALVAVLLIGGAILFAGQLGERVATALDDSSSTVAPGQEVIVVVEGGSSAASIGDQLAAVGVVDSADEFESRVGERRLAPALQAGVFTLFTGMELDAVIDALASGNTEFQLTVIEGLTVDETLAAIAEPAQLSVAELQESLLDGSVTSALIATQPADLQGWEGLLFPDTYRFLVGSSATTVLQRLSDTMASRVASVDWSRLEELGVSQYEAIIIASLIEEEVRVETERPLVASVIYNRLRNDWLLQIDATVQYALPARKPALSFADLEIDSPYNTYLYRGLPPTPIAGVRLTSLQGAADPAESGYFYYVLTSADGRHGFAETDAEFAALKEQARADGVLP